MEQVFIDRFIMPKEAKTEFMERMQINRNLISKLPGFIGDEAYIRIDEKGYFRCTTMAFWASEDALKNAKALVQAQYQQQGFDMPAMLARLGIQMEREQYQRLKGVE
jgi:heme-degrading monooxygenase HmoA